METIGDAYMVVSGVPIPNGSRHVYIMADLALELLQTIIDFTIPHIPDRQLKIRIGQWFSVALSPTVPLSIFASAEL